MQKKNRYIILNFVTAFAVTLFFSCQSKYDGVQNFRDSEAVPMAEGVAVNLKYTDSGKLVAILRAPRLLDYNNLAFGYREFPDGVKLDVIDQEGKTSVITAEYAISYTETGIIDLRGNVDIKTADSTHLKAEQLYWDHTINWIFTDHAYTSYLPDGTINEADGFDANQDFTILNSRINDGVMYLEE